jgi:hypothetical protein
MISWPLASSVRRELVERGWMMIASPIPFVSQIDPQPAGLGLAGSRRQYLDRRFIGMDGDEVVFAKQRAEMVSLAIAELPF